MLTNSMKFVHYMLDFIRNLGTTGFCTQTLVYLSVSAHRGCHKLYRHNPKFLGE